MHINWKKTNRWVRKAAKILAITLLVLVLLDLAIAHYMYSSLGAIPTKGAKYPPAAIREVVWPTLCCPAIVTPGGKVDVEFDFRKGDEKKPQPQPSDASNWKGSISGVQSSALTFEQAWIGPSAKWPAGSRGGKSDSVWHARFMLAGGVPLEMYDLNVEADVAGKRVKDTQLHSVTVVAPDQKEFRFITLADIHVHERKVSGLFNNVSDKGIAPDNTPLYLREAIAQVNLIRPDFVIMLGDYVYAQRRMGEYQPEFKAFFDMLKEFEVPVFAIPGNHDLYVNQVDGERVWEENMGPLYYSFDFGGSHFTCTDTYEWPADIRTVTRKFWGLFTFPRTGRGKAVASKNEASFSTYQKQLRWIESDVKAHQDSVTRIMAAHHDPYRPGGKGDAYTQKYQGFWPLAGDHGRKSLRKICADLDVNMVLSGHNHTDYVGKAPWANRKGETIFANQTCVTFDKGGDKKQYPGYRLVTVKDGSIQGYSYLDSYHSYPFYDGSSVKGKTDLDNLSVPALQAEEAPELEDEDGLSGVTVLKNYLGVPMLVRGMEGESTASCEADGGRIYQSTPIPGSKYTLHYIEADIPAGEPGESASYNGSPGRLWVIVFPQ